MSIDGKNLPLFNTENTSDREMYNKNGYSLFYTDLRKDVNAVRDIPRLIVGGVTDVQIGEPYTSYKFGYKEQRVGLKEFVCIPETSDTPRIYILDEHHHAFYCWAEARASGLIQSDALLVHIDDHGDEVDKTNKKLVNMSNLKEVAQFTNEALSEGEFVKKAQETQIVGRAIWVDDRLSIDGVDVTWNEQDYIKVGVDNKIVSEIMNGPVGDMVLDIDLDFFARHLYEWSSEKLLQDRKWEGDVVSLLEHDLDIVRNLMKKAKVVTIATSPGYLKPELAQMLVRKLLEVEQ